MKHKRMLILSILTLGLIVIYLLVGLISHKIGSYYYNKGNLQKAVSFYKIATKTLPFLNISKQRFESIKKQLGQNEKNIDTNKLLVSLDKSSVSVVNKNIFKSSATHRGDQIIVAGIFQNNSNIRIPYFKTSKIILLDNDVPVATKDFYREISLNNNGESPFQIFIPSGTDGHVPHFNDFYVEFEIPPFVPDDRAMNLKIVDSKIISKSPRGGGEIWDYKASFTILNDTNSTVGNIYRTTFLKYKGNHLGEYRTSGRVFVEIKRPQSNIVNLDKIGEKDYERLALKPNEMRNLEFNLVVDEEYQGRFNPNDVQLVGYFSGKIE